MVVVGLVPPNFQSRIAVYPCFFLQKISDFGLATQQVRPCDSQMTMCGTPNVMAPEVAREQPHGPGVDMWGLGALLYTLLMGETPPKSLKVSISIGLH